jgi:hypothetical protein
MPNDQELWAAKVREQNAILGAREKDVQELLWLHAEATWQRDQADALRLYAVTVALAAMVPADRPARELLEWTDALARPEAAGRAA